MTPRGILSRAAILASLTLSGCIGDPDAPGPDTHRAQWKKNEPALYAYTVEHVCFCPGGPVHVVADRDSVLTAEMDDSVSKGIPAGALSPQSYSIDSLFDEVEGRLRFRHDSRKISFDATYGFPADVHIDFSKQMADEEYGLLISDFRPLNAIP